MSPVWIVVPLLVPLSAFASDSGVAGRTDTGTLYAQPECTPAQVQGATYVPQPVACPFAPDAGALAVCGGADAVLDGVAHSTVESAIQAASPGSTVFVCPGTYYGLWAWSDLTLAAADPTPGATVLRGDVEQVGTPEHLLAALAALGVTDALVEVQGPEVPILDGSADPWCEGLVGAGLVEGPALRPHVVDQVVEVAAHGGRAMLRPADRCEVAVEVDYGPPWQGSAEVMLGGGAFCREVAWARTFVHHRDLERLRAAGRGLGATPASTVLLGEREARVPLRAADEPVRHKLLDAVGDLALVGPILGRFEVSRGSHLLHLALLRSWLAGA